ncbi:hypothetical protein V1520DRAFT_349282 [Lipomyces starkeyi]
MAIPSKERTEPRIDGVRLLLRMSRSLEFDGQHAREIIEPGKNRDGFWISDDMVQHLARAMEMFENLHPGCVGLFCFDQSRNHQGFRAMTKASIVRKSAGAFFAAVHGWCGSRTIERYMDCHTTC